MTQEERDQKYMEYTNEAFWTGHYHFLTQALAIAMQSTMVWRLVGTGTPFTYFDLFHFAKKRDEEDPLNDDQFFMVSDEGAIGFSPGLEFLTEWIFVPMEPCEERERLLQEVGELLHQQKEIRESIDNAVEEGLERERQQKLQQESQQARQYMMLNGDQQIGPFSIDELLRQSLTVETYVWTQGMAQWQMAGQVPEIVDAMRRKQAAPPPPPIPSQIPVPPVPPPVPQRQAASSDKYYTLDDEEELIGPFTVDELLRHNLKPAKLVKSAATGKWQKASDVEELKKALGR